MNCDKEIEVTVGDTNPVLKLKAKSALFFRADLQADADGSPRAFHPTNEEDSTQKVCAPAGSFQAVVRRGDVSGADSCNSARHRNTWASGSTS